MSVAAQTVETIVANVCEGLALLNSCVESQVLAGFNREQAYQRMYDSYQARIEELPRMKPEHHMRLISAISTTGWDPDKKQSLIELLQSRMIVRHHAPPRAKLQNCEHFENMIADVMWDELKRV